MREGEGQTCKCCSASKSLLPCSSYLLLCSQPLLGTGSSQLDVLHDKLSEEGREEEVAY